MMSCKFYFINELSKALFPVFKMNVTTEAYKCMSEDQTECDVRKGPNLKMRFKRVVYRPVFR